MEISLLNSMADTGFPRRGLGGGGQPLSLGQKPTIWQGFCRKLHENQRNWTGEEGASLVPP